MSEVCQSHRKIIERNPNEADVLHLLGIIADQQGEKDKAIELIGRAIALDPNAANYHTNLGNALRSAGRLDEAIAAHRKALALNPNSPEALYNLANALCPRGALAEAADAYRQSIQLKPTHADAFNNLANVLKDQGNLAEALANYRQAARLNANSPAILCNLGIALHLAGQFDESLSYCREALKLKPDFADAHYNLANALYAKNKLSDAAIAYRHALALRPNYPEAQNNLANVLSDQGRLGETISVYREALRLKPDSAEVHWNLALNLLLQGNFKEGWPELEWRWKTSDFQSQRRNFPQPQWTGGDPRGKTILLHAEQGFGDTIQFARYAPLLAARGAKVIFETPWQLAGLFKSNADLGQIVVSTEPLPHFDLHCPLLSLPRAFQTELQTIPASTPYLRPDPEHVRVWENRLESRKGKLRIGLAWAGNPGHRRDHRRSIELSALAPLASPKNAVFFSLQKGPAAAQATHPPSGMELFDFGTELTDFAQTAALVANLDLVISVDTAVVHLAGALNKPCWVLLARVPDWRWLMDRDDSPWYPSVKLFRQKTSGDWPEVVGRAADTLRQFKP
jgi:tetratricopeptide (TPR) repeat protein